MPKYKHQNPSIQKPNIENISVLRKFFWLRQNFAYCLAISALIWIVGICYYIENFIGWSSIIAISPVDFGSFILSSTIPLIAIWFILAYIERSSSLDANAELFQTYINSLMYPDEAATKNAKALASAIQAQVQLMQKENKTVVAQSAQLKKDLDIRLTELSNILNLLDNYSAKTLTELNDGVKTLADRCTYITDKTINSVTNMQECTTDITQNSDKFLSKINPILEEISAVSANIKNNIITNRDNLGEIKKQLLSCADISEEHVKEMLIKITTNSKNIEKSFYKTAEEYDALYKRLDASISGVEGRIEEQKHLLHTQTQVLDHNSDLIDNKLSKYGQAISLEIDKLVKSSIELEKFTKKQISVLRSVNSEAGKAVHNIGNTFDEKRADLERHCEYAINSMQNVIIALNKETEKLISFTNITQVKNSDLQNIAETIVDKVGDMSNKLALKTDTLKDKAVDVIGKFTEASDLINSSTEKLNTSSKQIFTNTKESSKLLEEQNFYITNTISNMDLVSSRLNKLNTDIQKAAETLHHTLRDYDKKIGIYENLRDSKFKIEPNEPEFNQEKLCQIARGIMKFLTRTNINPEKLFEGYDMFDLWDSYLEGKQTTFTDILTKNLSIKQTLSLRKTFDDNAEFHNLVIQYLFLMDLLIKNMLKPTQFSTEELINLSVNSSLEKIYFVLIKALNNVD